MIGGLRHLKDRNPVTILKETWFLSPLFLLPDENQRERSLKMSYLSCALETFFSMERSFKSFCIILFHCFLQALDHFWLHLLKLFNSYWRAGGKIESHLSPDAQTGPLALCPSCMCTWRGGTGAGRDLTVPIAGPWHWDGVLGAGITSHDSPTLNTTQAKWATTTPSRLPIGELATLTIKALPRDVRCV